MLSLKNVTVVMDSIIAVEDVSLEISAGEYVCLVGANGSGKSSLLKAILGLVPIRSGSVELSVPRSKVAYIAQIDGSARDFPATVGEVVLSGTQKPGTLPFYTRGDRRAAQEAMRDLGLHDLADRPVGHLSGGQRQRVFLARALCRNPELILLDEPCAGLDAASARELYAMLAALNAGGVTVLMATHDLHEVEHLPVRVIALERSLLYDGNAEGWCGE